MENKHKAPSWAKWKMTQDGNTDLFWWVSESRMQAVSLKSGEGFSVQGIKEEELNQYKEGQFRVKMSRLKRDMGNK